LQVGSGAIIPLTAYQRADVESPARFQWDCWARQTGKSFTKSLRRLLRGLARRRTQILLSAGERQSLELMLKVRRHCQALQIASRFHRNLFLEGTRFRRLTIELPGGVRIIGLPANPLTARGFTGDVLLDEFAMHHEDRAIWAAVFPAVLRGDGELDVASTPRGAANMFAALRDNALFRRTVVTLADAMAAGLPADAEALRTAMGDEELFRQEFDCDFLEAGGVFLPAARIAGVEDPTLAVADDPAGLESGADELYGGVDIGRVRDLTVFWVVQRCGGVLVTRMVRCTADEPFRRQREALRALLSLRGLRRCCIDAGGMGMPLAEEAQEAFGPSRVEPVVFTPAVKDELATRLRVRVEEGTIRIPADPAVRADWQSIRRSVATCGPPRYAAGGAGGNGDRFWAACLAVRAAERGGAGPAEVLCGRGPRFARAGIW